MPPSQSSPDKERHILSSQGNNLFSYPRNFPATEVSLLGSMEQPSNLLKKVV